MQHRTFLEPSVTHQHYFGRSDGTPISRASSRMYELNGISMVRNDRTILSIDHLEIPTHELTLILGHNGSGKSTLASIISGLVKPDAGTTKLEGCDLFTLSERERAQRAAFLPQKLPASEGLTCRDSCVWDASLGAGFLADGALKMRRLLTRHSRLPAQRSMLKATSMIFPGANGERVWISMLLAQASPVMILDEPTSALDVRHQYGTLALLERLNRETGARRYCDHSRHQSGTAVCYTYRGFEGGESSLFWRSRTSS